MAKVAAARSICASRVPLFLPVRRQAFRIARAIAFPPIRPYDGIRPQTATNPDGYGSTPIPRVFARESPMIRFLHAADLHLGMRITRFGEDACNRIGESRFTALQQLREKAKQLEVQFLLIAGDLFDDHSVSRTDAARAFGILESAANSCPVFIIPGNHDPLVPGAVWDRDPWLRDQPHLRVHFLRNPEPIYVDGLPVTIFPCPLRQRRSIDDPTAWIATHPRCKDD